MRYKTQNKTWIKRLSLTIIGMFFGFGIIVSCSGTNKKTSPSTQEVKQTSKNNDTSKSPAYYICSKFDGQISRTENERSFVGEIYRCDVEKQWDMAIQSEINLMAIEDKFVGKLEDEWKKTAVDSKNYYRGSFPFESDEYYIVNLYVPFNKKTDHFFISQ